MLIIILGIGALFVLLCLSVGRNDDPPTIPHRGIEMKARNGKLIHVRETYSEKEL